MKQEFINIYDEFRDAVLNKEYYAVRIEKTRRKLKRIDIYLALFIGGSGAAGFALWDTSLWGIEIGQILFAFFAGIAVILGIAKPYLKLEDELERLSSIHGSYSAIEHSLKDVVINIKTVKKIDRTNRTVFDVLRQVRGMLVSKEDLPAQKKIVKDAQEVVNRRYPTSFFYYPEED